MTAERLLYFLTDGTEIIGTDYMTGEEAVERERDTREKSGGDLYWTLNPGGLVWGDLVLPPQSAVQPRTGFRIRISESEKGGKV